MSATETKMRAGRKWALTVAVGLASGAIATAGAGAAQPEPAMDGAPETAEVRLQSTIGLPPAAYSLVCVPGFSGCTTSGNIDLTTSAAVPVAYDPAAGATHGVGTLSYSSAEGTVRRSFACEGEDGTYESTVVQDATSSGELEVSKITAVEGTNTLSVALNHGGDTGGEYPREFVDRADGGCGSPNQELTQPMAQWYYQFYLAHRAGQQEVGNDLEVTGLAYENGVFAKTFDRFVEGGEGENAYPVYENTRIEVEPEFCGGEANRIASASANGEPIDINSSRFYVGQVITAPAETKIRLGDGSVIVLDKGAVWRIDDCDLYETKISFRKSVRSFWTKVKKTLGGSNKKFEIMTERAVAGVRGTILDVSYDERKELTRVAVKEGTVSLRGINGAKGKVLIHAGEVGVQKGKRRPRIVSG